jgi:hypothetical protein
MYISEGTTSPYTAIQWKDGKSVVGRGNNHYEAIVDCIKKMCIEKEVDDLLANTDYWEND